MIGECITERVRDAYMLIMSSILDFSLAIYVSKSISLYIFQYKIFEVQTNLTCKMQLTAQQIKVFHRLGLKVKRTVPLVKAVLLIMCSGYFKNCLHKYN